MTEFTKRTVQELPIQNPVEKIPGFLDQGDIVICWTLEAVVWGIVGANGVTLGASSHGDNLTIKDSSWADLLTQSIEIRGMGEQGKRLLHAIRPSVFDAWAGTMLTEQEAQPCPQALQGEALPVPSNGKATYLTLDQKYWLWGVDKPKSVQQIGQYFWVKLTADRIKPFWVPMATAPQAEKKSVQLVSREFFMFSPKNQALILADALPASLEYF